MKVTVEQMIEQLQNFPRDAFVYAYEGEISAVVVATKEGDQLGYIIAEEE